jgi:hypothetical protein
MAVVSSCRKEDKSVFDKSPDERINEALAKYQADILSSPNGWRALYHTGSGQDFNFYFTFNDQNRVVMYSEFDTASTSPRESSYRIKALQQPSLIFDTYSYLHTLADPNPYVNGGDVGAGLVADFEFAFDDVVGDTIKLKGRQNSTTLNLIKATKEDAGKWVNGDWKKALGFQHIGDFLTYFKRSTIGGLSVDIEFYHYSRQIVIYTYNSSGIRTAYTSSFTYSPDSPNGIVLRTPLKIGTATVSTLTDMTYNSANNTIGFKVNGTTASTVGEAIAPVTNNKNGATDWWLQGATKLDVGYWVNVGFHSNGVEDAFKVSSIGGYYYTVFLPAIDTINSTTYYDWMAYAVVKNDSLKIAYTTTTRMPTFTSDGRAIFALYKPDDPTAPASVLNTTAALTDPNGFRFIQVNSTTVDMVGVKDAKTWMRWYWLSFN